jgi:hypothetical protein
LGCGAELTGDVVTLEHALPQWLAKEIDIPGVNLRHFLHDESKPEDALLRSHKLNTFGSRKVCCFCNNGWMSRLETQAKPYILDLMGQKASLLTLEDSTRLILSRWAVKTAFMIAAVQSIRYDLPWARFQSLREYENDGPNGCFVLASQQPCLPKGFLFTCPADVFSNEKPVQLRLGFSVNHLHFVVVLPILDAPRMVKTSGMIHIPMWPLELHVLAGYGLTPKDFHSPDRFMDYMTNLVEVGVVQPKEGIRLDVARENSSLPTVG